MGWLSNRSSMVARLLHLGPREKTHQDNNQAPAGLAIVRRGLSRDYYFFVDIFATQNRLQVIVDRRVTDRRRRPEDVSRDRRSTDRRGALPKTWHQADIVVPQSHEWQEDASNESAQLSVNPLRR
jgi:hypothetical protein